jgi:hypothetical protein
MKSRRTIWTGRVARTVDRRGAFSVFVGKPEGKRPLARPWYGWVYNITMDFKEVGWRGMDWIDLVQDRDKWGACVNSVINFRFP